MKEPAIIASVLGADYARLGHEVAELEAAGVDRIQWDIMDGRFVPNLTFGADVVGACRPHAAVPAELLVAGSAILAHPKGRPAAVGELRRSLQPDIQAPSEERAVH
jgi:hypothetical protein